MSSGSSATASQVQYRITAKAQSSLDCTAVEWTYKVGSFLNLPLKDGRQPGEPEATGFRLGNRRLQGFFAVLSVSNLHTHFRNLSAVLVVMLQMHVGIAPARIGSA